MPPTQPVHLLLDWRVGSKRFSKDNILLGRMCNAGKFAHIVKGFGQQHEVRRILSFQQYASHVGVFPMQLNL